MPAFLALLGLVGVGWFWVSRMRNAAEATHELAGVASDVMAAARRFGFRRRNNRHPVESIDSTQLGIGALALAFLELDGLPSAEQHSALIASLQSHSGQTHQEAEETLILGRWLIGQCNGAEPAVERIARRLARLDRTGSFDPLMAVLNGIARAGRTGEVSDRQMDALTEIARHFKVR